MNIENVAYCGLYCAECPNHTGIIVDIARDLRKELRTYRFDKTAELLSQYSFFKQYEKYRDCYDVFGAMVKMRCGKTCRKRSGNPSCKIRLCCKKKKLDGCWDCSEFNLCNKLDFLKTNHGCAHIKNIEIISKKGIDEFINGKKHWYLKEKE